MSQAIFGRAFKASKCLPWVIAAIAIGGCNQGGSSSTGGVPTASSGAGASAQSTSSTLSISGTPPAQVVSNQLYSFVPKVIAPAGSVYSFSIQNKPSWATFSTVNGSLSGTPSTSDVGTDGNIVISMSNARSTVALAAFAIVVSAAAPPTSSSAGSGASLVFSYQNGLSAARGVINLAWGSSFSGSNLLLTNGAGLPHQADAAWYNEQENIQSFTTDFTFQLQPSAFGFTFCIQNTNSTANPKAYGTNASADANGLGYGAYTSLAGQYPIHNSIAIKFDTTDGNSSSYLGQNPSSTGLYINGGPNMGTVGFIPENDLVPLGINLHSGDVFAAHIVYDGSLLTMVLQDTVTGVQARMSWPIDIPAAVGSDSAWLGFTGGTVTPGSVDILTWDLYEGYKPRLSTPTFSVPAGSYTSTHSVSLSGPPGATIYYTTDGQPPTTSSTQYGAPISVSSSEIIQAIAVESGYTDSLVGVANYQIAPEMTPVINFPSGLASASNLIIPVGAAQFSGSDIQLTNTANPLEASAAWYADPVNVQSFTTNFTIQLTSPSANGMTFCIQNQNPTSTDGSSLYVSGGPYAVGFSQAGLGYQGILSSVAVKFDLYTGSGDTTGLYTNGATPTTPLDDMTSSGLSLHSGNPLSVQLTYDGTTLSMTITDTVTHQTFSRSWPIDIPGTVGGNTAYVGFTGATGGLSALQKVLSWTYSND